MNLEWSSNSVHKLISQFHFLKYLKHQLPLNLIKSSFCFKRPNSNRPSCSCGQVSVLNQHKTLGAKGRFLNKKWFDAAPGWWQPSQPRKICGNSSNTQRGQRTGAHYCTNISQASRPQLFGRVLCLLPSHPNSTPHCPPSFQPGFQCPSSFLKICH